MRRAILTGLWQTLNRSIRWAYLTMCAVSLVLTLAISAPQPFLAQTPSPTTPAELIQEIRQQATKDFGNGISREAGTGFVLDTYGENEFDLAPREIRQVYDEAYSAAQAVHRPSLVNRLIPEDGFVVGSLILVAGIIGATLKDAVTKTIQGIYQKINDWIYARYAGSRFFEAVALHRYRTQVFASTKHLKIPFRVNRPPLSMEDIFVPLKVAGATQDSEIDAYQCITTHQRLMVTGPPGSGKSMLLKHVALSYGTGRLHSLLAERPIPVLLELHRVNNPKLTSDELLEALAAAFERNDFPKAERFIQQGLQSGQLMLLLDGLDEVSREARTTVVRRINDLLNQYRECRAIITCRTQVYGGEFDGVANQTLEVVEFSDQQIRRFLESWKQEMPPEKSINQLMQTLRDRPRIMALARNPLLLTIIAYLYTDTPFVLPHSRAEFYQKSTDILLDQWQKDFNRYRANDKRRVLEHLALYNQDQGMQARQDRRSIDYATVLAELRKILPDLNLSPDSAKLLLDEIVERSGLFLKIDSGDRYQFAHLTVQEFFAAVALQNNVEGLMQRFEQEPTAWREVVKLWCGLTGDSTGLIEAVYRTDKLTGLECLADAQEVAPDLSREIIDEFKQQIGRKSEFTFPAPNNSLHAAFGAVAADLRPRGKEVFEFLTAGLEDQQSTERYLVEVASILALTNLPKAAEALAHTYSDVTRPFLVQMGDIAVPALAKLSANPQAEVSEVIEDLFNIGTPEAAEVLIKTLLKADNELSSSQAAWSLAGLIHRPLIEDHLKTFIWPDNYPVKNEFIWLWKPYLNAHSFGFEALASEIAFYLVNPASSLLENKFFEYLKLDPRFVIALCGVSSREIWKGEVMNQIKTWPQEADLLLAQESFAIGTQLFQSFMTVDISLKSQIQAPPQWFKMMWNIGPKERLDLIKRLIKFPPATKNDWKNLFNTANFDFGNHIAYRYGILNIALGMSAVAIFKMGWLAYQYYEFWPAGLLGLGIFVIILFWKILLKDLNKTLHPTLFWELGVSGLPRFIGEFWRFFRKGTNIPEVDLLAEHLKQQLTIALITFAFALTMISSVIGIVFFSNVFAVTVTVAVTFAVFSVVTADSDTSDPDTFDPKTFLESTNFGILTIAVTSAFATAITAFVVIDDANILVAAVTFIGAWFSGLFVAMVVWPVACLLVGSVAYLLVGSVDITLVMVLTVLGVWPESNEYKPLKTTANLFALPWFCWFPLTLVFGTLGVHTLLTWFSPLSIHLWAQTFALVGTLLLIASSLGWWGYRRSRAARNPLQGGHLEKVLRSLRR